LTYVTSRDNEEFDIMLKRFRKKVESDGINTEFKSRLAYEKPSERKKRKQMKAQRKIKKKQMKNQS